ncbi:MAG: capsule biosynthesis protein CapA [Marinibacterium sp.]|nr:capsule biosynthesis protein CapA [Marinibacterium sp.]
MTKTAHSRRVFLLLQGPHGPFFAALGQALRRAGHGVWRVGFNISDRAFWRDPHSYIPYRDPPEHWPDRLATLLAEHQITDVVLYGDTRPVHASAIAAARVHGLTVHVLEEGYLRPYWITYERGGANGHSPLMQIGMDRIRATTPPDSGPRADAPAGWGDMRHHIFYGALYHGLLLLANRGYPGFRTHRSIPVAREFALYLQRLALMPLLALDRVQATWRLRRGVARRGLAFHLGLLQLEHDSNFRSHGPFDTMAGFLHTLIHGFAQGARADHHLVIKTHPLEDGRLPLRRMVRQLARDAGVSRRVHFLPGGKLAPLLDTARSAVTVNSTAGQQALWRGLPLRAFGRAVYAKPDLVSQAPLPVFFADPPAPDAQAYRVYRRFLLATSQVPGGYYSARGRARALPRLVAKMTATGDPYDLPQTG